MLRKKLKKEAKTRVLFITQWYKPINAPVKRMVRIAEHLAYKGHEVTVLTGMPSYPTGVLPPKYKWKWWSKEKDGKLNIIRTYEYPTPNKGVFKRLFNNISFTISSSIATLVLPSFDIIIVSSPSFLSGIPGLLALRRQKSCLIFDVRDLWPDSAVELGFIKKKWLVKILEKLEKLYYRKTNKILTATPGILNHLRNEEISEDKLVLLLNSVNTSFFKPQKSERKSYGFKTTDFIVIYIGNHGPAQNLKTFIKTAEILKRKKDIKFLLVGEGEEKNDLVGLAQRKNLKNIFFWPLQPMEKMAKIINLADICNISLAPTKIIQEAIPTKTLEYLSCGKPVIASVGGDLKKYLEKYQAGVVYQSNNENQCAQAILKLSKNPELKQKMGQNARRLALDVFSDQTFYQTLDRIFND